MKIIQARSLIIPAIRIIRFAKFCDVRGYFTEHFRKSDFAYHRDIGFLKNIEFVQTNESMSMPNTVRGLHFQWNPYMGKLVRTITGRMVDIVLDIRKGSPTFGKAIFYDMPARLDENYGEWIWVPPGFAHGNYFIEKTHIEYFCSGTYNPDCEASISPFSKDIDWSLADATLKSEFDKLINTDPIITAKDKNGCSVKDWENTPSSEQFVYMNNRVSSKA